MNPSTQENSVIEEEKIYIPFEATPNSKAAEFNKTTLLYSCDSAQSLNKNPSNELANKEIIESIASSHEGLLNKIDQVIEKYEGKEQV